MVQTAEAARVAGVDAATTTMAEEHLNERSVLFKDEEQQSRRDRGHDDFQLLKLNRSSEWKRHEFGIQLDAYSAFRNFAQGGP